jgi:peptidoglycan/LPS O-acetylase OafA/YrhL
MVKQANIGLPNTPMKVGQLTFTRFVAAILVVAFHHYKTNNLFSNANVFVSYFYLLSGFVLMLSQRERYTTKKEYITFYVNRFARIFPVYLLALFSFVALEGHVKWDLLLHTLGIQY